MAREEFEKWTRTISTQRVTKVDIPFESVVRIPIRTRREADLYLSKGVAIYHQETTLPNGVARSFYYIEVEISALAEVALK